MQPSQLSPKNATVPLPASPSPVSNQPLAGPVQPRGPKPQNLILGHLPQFSRDPLGTLHLAAQYGPLARLRFLNRVIYIPTEPDDVKHILVDNHRNYTKGEGQVSLKELLGEGLLNAEGAHHQRQRRLIQPAFHRNRIENYGSIITRETQTRLAGWQDGEQRDIHEELMQLTMVIIGHCLFDVDLSNEAARLGHAVGSLIEGFRFGQIGPIGRAIAKLDRGYQRARQGHMAVLNEAIYAIIQERRSEGVDRGDLLSMLLAAQEEDEASGQPQGMTDQQVRDEAITLFSAGHETTANALTWTFYLLSQHPESEARLHAQLDQVLGDPRAGVTPTLDHLPDLPYVRQVFSEAMRLYPPAWIMGRTAIDDDVVAGVPIPGGTPLLVSQYVLHRNPRYWPQPDRFDPDRFAPDAAKEHHRYAYFPFGGGPRRCIGEPLAWMEGELILAAIAHRYRLRLAAGTVVKAQPRITLRVEGALPMIVGRRG